MSQKYKLHLMFYLILTTASSSVVPMGQGQPFMDHNEQLVLGPTIMHIYTQQPLPQPQGQQPGLFDIVKASAYQQLGASLGQNVGTKISGRLEGLAAEVKETPACEIIADRSERFWSWIYLQIPAWRSVEQQQRIEIDKEIKSLVPQACVESARAQKNKFEKEVLDIRDANNKQEQTQQLHADLAQATKNKEQAELKAKIKLLELEARQAMVAAAQAEIKMREEDENLTLASKILVRMKELELEGLSPKAVSLVLHEEELERMKTRGAKESEISAQNQKIRELKKVVEAEKKEKVQALKK